MANKTAQATVGTDAATPASAPAPAPAERKIGGIVVTKAETLIEPNSIMIYGRPKYGKSTLAASIAAVSGFDKVLCIDLEKGATAFSRSYPSVDVVNIPYLNISKLEDVIEALVDSPDALGYDAVILDTLSTAQQWVVTKMREARGGKKLDYDGWDTVAHWTMQLMWDLHHMAATGISLYHLTTKENELTKEIWTLPKLQGSAKDSVASVPDLIIHLRIVDSKKEGPVRVADFVPHENITSGNRFDWLPQVPIGNADMELLYSYIRGENHDTPSAPKTAAEVSAEKTDTEQ